MMLAVEDHATARGVRLGEFELDGRIIEVIDRGVHDNLLWLQYRAAGARWRCLGVIRWDEVHTPRATIAATEIGWVRSGSRRAEDLVSGAMTVYRRASGLSEVGDQAAREPSFAVDNLARLPRVAFDAVPRKPSPRPHTARRAATTSNPER